MPDKKPRGRPKVDWQPFEDELHRRLTTAQALPTVEAEARALALWGKHLVVPGGSPLQPERIRERIKKRHGGSAGYQNALAYNLMLLNRNEQA